jgi:hypothetical protein
MSRDGDAMEESETIQDEDDGSETSNSGTEVGERTAGNMDAANTIGKEGT